MQTFVEAGSVRYTECGFFIVTRVTTATSHVPLAHRRGLQFALARLEWLSSYAA